MDEDHHRAKLARPAFLLLLTACVVCACGGANSSGSSPTPSSLPDPTAPYYGLDHCPLRREACEFASKLSGWFLSGDVDAIITESEPQDWVCPGGAPNLDSFSPLCDGAMSGEIREGYPLFRYGSHGGIMSEEGLRQRVNQQQQIEGLKLLTLSCPGRGVQFMNAPCDDAFNVVFGQIDETADNPRIPNDIVGMLVVFYVHISKIGDDYKVSTVAPGPLHDLQRYIIDGGVAPANAETIWGTTFYRWIEDAEAPSGY